MLRLDAKIIRKRVIVIGDTLRVVGKDGRLINVSLENQFQVFQ